MSSPNKALCGQELEDLVGEARGLCDRLDLLRILRAPQLLDEPAGRDQGRGVGYGALELSQRGDAGRVLVVSDLAGKALGELCDEAPLDSQAVGTAETSDFARSV